MQKEEKKFPIPLVHPKSLPFIIGKENNSFQLVYVESLRLNALTENPWRGTVTFFFAQAPKKKVIISVTEKSFATNKRYGWFRFADQRFYETSEDDEAVLRATLPEIEDIQIMYLVLETDEHNTLLSVSIQSNEFSSLLSLQTCCGVTEQFNTEKQLLSQLFSILRTSVVQLLVCAGVSQPLTFLEQKYAQYWSPRELLKHMEVLDLPRFAQAYAQRYTSVKTAQELQQWAEEHDLLPYLRNAASKIGLSTQTLLDASTKVLLSYVASVYGGSFKLTSKEEKPILVRNTLKRATRLALLQALVLSAPEVYEYCRALPQESCYQILWSPSTNKEARLVYLDLLRTVEPAATNEDFVYAQKQTESDPFPVVDEIAVFLRIPSVLTVSESARSEPTAMYWFELAQNGQLRTNVALSKEQKTLLIPHLQTMALTRKDINTVLNILERKSFRGQ